MAIVTLRPDGVVTTSVDVPLSYGGAPSLNAAVANEPANDATYLRFPDYGSYWMVEFSFGTTAIPANAAVRTVTPRVRHNNAWSAAATTNRAFTLLTNGSAFDDEPITWSGALEPFSTTYAVQRGAARVTQPSGMAWTQSAIDGLTLRIFFRNGPSYYWSFEVSEVYVDVEYNLAPTVTGADLGVVATTRPRFTWTYADTEGDAQERFRVKVFSFAQYNGGGFDPKTTTPLVDSGEVYSSETSWVSSDLPNNDNYRAYISVSDAGSNGRYTPYTAAGPYTAARVVLTPPSVPTVTAVTDTANDRVAVTIASTNNINPATTYRYSVERSDDGGTTWVELTRLWVPGPSTVDYRSVDFATTASPSLTVYDYETQRGTVALYRARVKATKSGNSLQSPYSATATATAAVALVGWKLRSIMAPTVAATLRVHSELLTWQSEERQSVVYALGRSRPIVLSDAIGSERVEVDLTMLSEAEYEAFEAVRARMDVLLLQTGYGDARFVRFGQTRAATHIVKAGGARKYVVRASFIEVEA